MKKFRRIIYADTRLAWLSYTNEATLWCMQQRLFFSRISAWRQKGDAIYYASYFADKTFNPFVPYPIVGFYFILTTLATGIFGLVNRRLNRHLPSNQKARMRLRSNFIR